MVVLFRAVLMLTVLVGLPAAWIYYGPLPPMAQGAVDRVVEVVRDTMGWQQPSTESSVQMTAPRYAVASAEAPSFPTPGSDLPLVAPKVAPATSQVSLGEELKPLLEELRSMGSTKYSLEHWGQKGEFFRFCCAMPLVAREKHLIQQFEAVAETPRASIEQVVSEVAHWKTTH